MKTTSKMIHHILVKYEKHYQTQFKLIYNQEVLYNNINENNEASFVRFKVNHMEAVLSCSTNNFEDKLEGIVITLKELMKIDDIESIFEKSIYESLSHNEKQYLEEKCNSKEYSILVIQSTQECEYLLSTIKNILSVPVCELKNKRVVVLLPNMIQNQMLMEIKDTLEAELYCRIHIACSSVFYDLDDISKAYQEAIEYLNVLMKYDHSLSFVSKDDLWLAYVVENIKEDKAKDLLSRIDHSIFRKIDDELLNTIKVFLQNNLNISETSRQLYLHRNTLIYRIEKILSITNLDIRNFDDAVKMELLLLLKKRFEE